MKLKLWRVIFSKNLFNNNCKLNIMNNYIEDSGLFFKDISKKIQKGIDGFEIINLTMSMALGLEKLLKGILFDINPTYILIEPVFKNSIQIIYNNKLIKEPNALNDLAKNPNSDVITFKNSVLRAQCVSEATFKNKNILMNLSDARDIIAHCELKLIKSEKFKTILLRDFYPLLVEFSKELNIKRGHFFGGSHIKLAGISSKLQENLEKEIELLLDAHLAKWKSLSGNENYKTDKIKITQAIATTPNKKIVECPACEEEAILYLKPIFEYNPYLGENMQIGHEIKKFKCHFCKLEIMDSKKLDFLGINVIKDYLSQLCGRCGKYIEDENGIGICDECENYYAKEN